MVDGCLLFSVQERTVIYILVPGSNCLAWEIRNLQGEKKPDMCTTSLVVCANALVYLCHQQNKERAELLGRISLFCWMGSSICTTLVEVRFLLASSCYVIIAANYIGFHCY